MEFEWDDNKAALNIQKHGISFEQAALAFSDLFAIEWIDEREDYGEERIIIVGTSQGQILTVVYTERNERIRLISARRASKYEEELYFCHNGR